MDCYIIKKTGSWVISTYHTRMIQKRMGLLHEHIFLEKYNNSIHLLNIEKIKHL
jgi:hypothetical protein